MKNHLDNARKEIYVTDLELSLDYYKTILGFKKEDLIVGNDTREFCISLKQATDLKDVKPQKLVPEVCGTINMIDEFYKIYLKLKENGALFAYNPRDTYSEGKRAKEFAIRDIDGYVIAFKTILQSSEIKYLEHSLEN